MKILKKFYYNTDKKRRFAYQVNGFAQKCNKRVKIRPTIFGNHVENFEMREGSSKNTRSSI